MDAVDEDREEDDPGGGDVEDEGEVSLGWSEMEARFGVQWQGAWNADLEEEHDGREPDVDDEDSHDAELTAFETHGRTFAQGGDPDEEPSLGSFDRLMNQADGWNQRTALWGSWYGHGEDREADLSASEPSLGSLAVNAHETQDHWAQGTRDDREGGEDPTEHDGDVEPNFSGDFDPLGRVKGPFGLQDQ